MKHAIANVSGYKIPLIGIPESETLEFCDLCGDWFSIWHVRWTGKQFLCKGCIADAGQKTLALSESKADKGPV